MSSTEHGQSERCSGFEPVVDRLALLQGEVALRWAEILTGLLSIGLNCHCLLNCSINFDFDGQYSNHGESEGEHRGKRAQKTIQNIKSQELVLFVILDSHGVLLKELFFQPGTPLLHPLVVGC